MPTTAQIAGTFSRYDAVGIREELADVIYNISPEDTPFMSNAGRGSVAHTTYEWQTDALAASASNTHVEGFDIATFTVVTPTARVSNYANISVKDVMISGTLEATNRAGRRSELAYQLSKKSAELKRDMETMCLANAGAVLGSDSTARVTGGLGAMIGTNVSMQTNGVNPAWTTGAPVDPRTDGNQRTFTETILKEVVKLCYDNGAELDYLLVGSFNKQQVSGFAGIAGQRYNARGAAPTTIIGAADVYVSDFGNLAIVPDRFGRARDAWFVDREYTSLQYLRPFQTVSLAKTGDAEKRMILVEWGLKVGTEKALGLAADLTVS